MQAKIWNVNGWIKETDPQVLATFFDAAIADARFGVLETVEHHFTPQGYTKLYLLCESHFALHTFPEAGKTYFELSSCNEAKYNAFLRIIDGKLERAGLWHDLVST